MTASYDPQPEIRLPGGVPRVPGFYLKCGLHWTHLRMIFGDRPIVVCSDSQHATRYETRVEAEAIAQQLERAPWGVKHDVVEIPE